MPLYDYMCPVCARIKEVNTQGLPGYLFVVKCGECPDQPEMERQFPTRTSFKVEGYSAKNGYSDD